MVSLSSFFRVFEEKKDLVKEASVLRSSDGLKFALQFTAKDETDANYLLEALSNAPFAKHIILIKKNSTIFIKTSTIEPISYLATKNLINQDLTKKIRAQVHEFLLPNTIKHFSDAIQNISLLKSLQTINIHLSLEIKSMEETKWFFDFLDQHRNHAETRTTTNLNPLPFSYKFNNNVQEKNITIEGPTDVLDFLVNERFITKEMFENLNQQLNENTKISADSVDAENTEDTERRCGI